MYRIRRFGVMKTATVVAIMYMLIVGVFAVPFGLVALLAASTQGSGASGAGLSIFLVALASILVYGLLGWVFTAVAVAIYNVAARWVGGIEVEIESVAPPPPPPDWLRTGPASPPSSTASPQSPAPPPSTPPPSTPAAG